MDITEYGEYGEPWIITANRQFIRQQIRQQYDSFLDIFKSAEIYKKEWISIEIKGKSEKRNNRKIG